MRRDVLLRLVRFGCVLAISAASTVLAGGSRAMAGCANFSVDRFGNGQLYNGCLVYINVYWEDQGSCRAGCSVGAVSHTTQGITTPRGRYTYWECEGAGCNPRPPKIDPRCIPDANGLYELPPDSRWCR
jgi:hypothetical protein